MGNITWTFWRWKDGRVECRKTKISVGCTFQTKAPNKGKAIINFGTWAEENNIDWTEIVWC